MGNAVLSTDKIKNKTTGEEIKVGEIVVYKDGLLQTEDENNLIVDNTKKLDGKNIEDIYDDFNNIISGHLDSSIRLLPNSENNQSISNNFIVAVTKDEEIRVKGLNTYFLNGATASNNGYITINNPHRVSKIKELITANTNLYVLYEDGELYVMGKNSYGCLGIGNSVEQYQLVYSASNVEKIFASSSGHHLESNYAFILKKDGTLFATGRNVSGNLGLGDNLDKLSWNEVPFIDEIGLIVNVICAGTENASSYIITADGETLATGYNASGNLGFNDVVARNTFQKIPSLATTRIKQLVVSSGYYNANYSISVLALSIDGRLFSFGSNSFGQLGTGDVSQKNNPVLVFISLEEGEQIEKLYAPKAAYNFYFLTNKNKLYGAGNNSYGQLNQNNTTNSSLFIQILNNVKNIAITSSLLYGFYIGLYIVTTDNKLFVVGYNQRGSGGVNNLIDIKSAIDTKFEYANQIKQISSGGNTYPTINILLDNGKVFSCGNNESGQILMPVSNNVNRLTRIF